MWWLLILVGVLCFNLGFVVGARWGTGSALARIEERAARRDGLDDDAPAPSEKHD